MPRWVESHTQWSSSLVNWSYREITSHAISHSYREKYADVAKKQVCRAYCTYKWNEYHKYLFNQWSFWSFQGFFIYCWLGIKHKVIELLIILHTQVCLNSGLSLSCYELICLMTLFREIWWENLVTMPHSTYLNWFVSFMKIRKSCPAK